MKERYFNVEVKVSLSDILYEITDKELLQELKDRNIKQNEFFTLSIENKKRHLCDLLDLPYTVSIDELTNKIKDDL